MTVKDIRLFGDPVLRTPAAPVETFDKELRKLKMMGFTDARLIKTYVGYGLVLDFQREVSVRLDPEVRAVVDDRHFFEVSRHFAENVLCGFGRLDGRPVGVVANQPAFLAGVLAGLDVPRDGGLEPREAEVELAGRAARRRAGRGHPCSGRRRSAGKDSGKTSQP